MCCIYYEWEDDRCKPLAIAGAMVSFPVMMTLDGALG